MLEIKKIENKKEWEDFIGSQKFTLMTQSSQYGEFYEKMNEESFIIALYENGKIVLGSLVLSIHAKRANFLFLPYGPVGEHKKKYLELFFSYLKNIAEQKKYSFVRVSPFIENTEENRGLYSGLSFKKAPIHMLAETTWLLDLKQDEETILKNMNKNHRNLIRRCEKEEVKIVFSNDKKELNDFNKLHDLTAKKHNFVRFSDDYVLKEFESFSKNNEVSVLKAYLKNEQNNKLDSSAVVYFYKKMAAYRHGASLNLNNKIPTPYLLQWSSIKEAKKRGLSYYNFWGIAPEDASPKHPFKGITHFKKGFGGFKIDLLHSQDMIISKKYYFNWIIEVLRAKKRGF
jgi:lipid II:glycine glycyltransferase (peptidoglycan interpeptide bridge formation enzyme)